MTCLIFFQVTSALKPTPQVREIGEFKANCNSLSGDVVHVPLLHHHDIRIPIKRILNEPIQTKHF